MTSTDPRVVVIGSGFAGLGAAIRLRAAGFTRVTILERADAVGGTWRDNAYPGAACDIPAHLYSFSFAPRPDWSSHYPGQPELRAYLEDVTDRFGLRSSIEFGAEVVETTFDGTRAVWHIGTADGRRYEAEAVVAALGPLSDPKLPDLPGIEDFAGVQFHSARWDHAAELDGKRIATIGTGASSIQFVPHLAERAASLTVLQRSAPWIIPRVDRPFSPLEQAAFRRVPGLRRLFRTYLYWQKELRFVGFRKNSPGMAAMAAFSRWHLRRSVTDPALREVLRPDHDMGCKRILISSDYWPALDRPNVTVETAGIDRITPAGIRLEDGREVEVDVLVWGTGFAVQAPLGPLAVTGLDGRRLDDAWDPAPVAHNGITVPGFPNFFVLLGPNTGLGHNSMIHVMESQFAYVVDAVRRLTDPEVAYLDVRPDAMDAFVREVDRRSGDLVWTSGCRSWYLTPEGRNFALWPGFTFEYRRRVAQLDEDAYRVVPPSELPAPVRVLA